jgi:Insertion element 4 transposase N-terminal
LPGQFVMPSDLPSIDSTSPGDRAARVAAGPGFWTEWLAGLSRQGLLEELLADGVIARALREAPTRHRYHRALDAKMTVICVLVACLFPGEGYDAVLTRAFGLPGLRFRPGKVPSGSAFSQARKLLGDLAVRKIFELDAERADAELGITALWKGLEVTAMDGTTMELARDDTLACEFGSSSEGGRPLLRIAAHVRTATRRWIAAGIGSYHDGESHLADGLAWSFRPGMLNLADRGFFSMDRFVRFAATGADLAWRVKNSAKSVPCKTLEILPDGSELVILHESGGMLARRRRETRNHAAPRHPDIIARLVTFTVLTRTCSGRSKITRIRGRRTRPGRPRCWSRRPGSRTTCSPGRDRRVVADPSTTTAALMLTGQCTGLSPSCAQGLLALWFHIITRRKGFSRVSISVSAWACKALYTGSIPVSASLSGKKRPLTWPDPL